MNKKIRYSSKHYLNNDQHFQQKVLKTQISTTVSDNFPQCIYLSASARKSNLLFFKI